MPREALDRKILYLKNEILVMGSMVESAVFEAMDALQRQDINIARNVIAGDLLINAKRFELENEIILTISTQQPVLATDLRIVASFLEIIAELERMGDYAKGIGRVCLMSSSEPHVKHLVGLPRMADLAVDMLHRAVEAFINFDIETAKNLPAEDDQIDALYNQVYRELVNMMINDPSIIDRANYMMWAAHNLERMADRVANICERTIYIVTGELSELSASDDEYKKW